MVVLVGYIEIRVAMANAAVKVFFMKFIILFNDSNGGAVGHRIKRRSEPGSRCSRGWWRWIRLIGLTSIPVSGDRLQRTRTGDNRV